MNPDLIRKYNVPGPRYTSYPTVPYWDESFFGVEAWKNNLIAATRENSETGISLYIHLPFCESLCTFCGCFKRITKNHAVEKKYIEALLKEWRLYCSIFDKRPLISEIHLGGGTPTFFSADRLEDLVNGLFAMAEKAPGCSMSFEGHPNNTTREHLQRLYNLGFRRVSFGVQDYDENVQRAINRIQPLAQVAKVTIWAKEIGYDSVGHDVVYGLPFQTTDNVRDTLEKTIALGPDTLAFYSYAHVPWLKGNGQRGFCEDDLPSGESKRELYETGKRLLIENDYFEIGMDHFAVASDPLHQAAADGTLHRNFMGYTVSTSKTLIGLGVSSISDSGFGFAQNAKSFDDYYQMIEWGVLPVIKGHSLTKEDMVIRQHILNVLCRFETSWQDPEMHFADLHSVVGELVSLAQDGLIVLGTDHLKVTQQGRPFLRNICMAFDLKLKRHRLKHNVFSLTI